MPLQVSKQIAEIREYDGLIGRVRQAFLKERDRLEKSPLLPSHQCEKVMDIRGLLVSIRQLPKDRCRLGKLSIIEVRDR